MSILPRTPAPECEYKLYLAIMQAADDGNPHCGDVVAVMYAVENDVDEDKQPMVGCDQSDRNLVIGESR